MRGIYHVEDGFMIGPIIPTPQEIHEAAQQLPPEHAAWPANAESVSYRVIEQPDSTGSFVDSSLLRVFHFTLNRERNIRTNSFVYWWSFTGCNELE